MGERCVHARTEVARCRNCVDACPNGAWRLNDEALELDTEACDGCGLCAPVCPDGAIRHAFEPALRRGRHGAVAFLACDASGLREEEGVVPCLHGFGLHDLLRLYRTGVRRLVVARGACSSCPRGRAAGLDQLVMELNAALSARTLHPIALREHPPARWRALLSEHRDAAPGPAMSRRNFLRHALGRAAEEGLRLVKPVEDNADDFLAPGQILPPVRAGDPLPHVPVIDPDGCDACDACVKICSHGAIVFDAAQCAYRVDAAACTGCGLCEDVCDENAVEVGRWRVPSRTEVLLDETRCRGCGNSFRTPQGKRPVSELCAVCESRGHFRALYQVLD